MKKQFDGMLVGDRGYPCLPFLITPIANTATDEERMFNNIHTRTRQIVERTFRVWKRRFPCLSRGLTTNLCSTTTIVACAVLHNMSLIIRDVLPEDDDKDNESNIEVPVAALNMEDPSGIAARETLIARMFN